MRVLTTRLRCGVLYRFRMVKTSFRLPHGCGGISGVSHISRVWGRHSPTRFPQGQNERKANFGTAVESCSVTAADLPLSGFSVHRTDRTGLAARCGRSFFLSPKILLKGCQLPAGRGFFKISLCPLLRTKIKSAKHRDKKFPPHLLLQSELGKMAVNGARQQKKQQIFFKTYCFRWPRRWRLVFSFKNSFHIGMINGELLRYVFKRKRLLLEYIPQNMQSLYLSQCSIYIVFQQ